MLLDCNQTLTIEHCAFLIAIKNACCTHFILAPTFRNSRHTRQTRCECRRSPTHQTLTPNPHTLNAKRQTQMRLQMTGSGQHGRDGEGDDISGGEDAEVTRLKSELKKAQHLCYAAEARSSGQHGESLRVKFVMKSLCKEVKPTDESPYETLDVCETSAS